LFDNKTVYFSENTHNTQGTQPKKAKLIKPSQKNARMENIFAKKTIYSACLQYLLIHIA